MTLTEKILNLPPGEKLLYDVQTRVNSLSAKVLCTTDELIAMAKELEAERQFICRKCGLRQELGTKQEATF